MAAHAMPMEPIGVIHTPYNRPEDVPIQGRFREHAEGRVELEKAFVPGLKDLEGFTYAYLLYHFHLSDKVNVTGKPYLEDVPHGVFAIRGPHRPNHIGLSIVRIEEMLLRGFRFTQVDMVDGTPLLDIKPYVAHFDGRSGGRNGWLDKHFVDGKIPDKAVWKNE